MRSIVKRVRDFAGHTRSRVSHKDDSVPQAAAKSKRLFRTSPHTKDQLPPEKKKSAFASPGGLVVAALGLLFVGYIFNVAGLQTTIDAQMAGLNQSAHGHDKQMARLFINALPVFGAVPVLLLIFALLRGRGTSKKTVAKTRAREIRGIEAFVEAAEAQGVSPKIARAAYRMMLPYVRKGKHLGAGDTLSRDLKVKSDEISNVYGSLLRHTNRRRTVGDDASQIQTVLDLMLAVEGSESKELAAAGTFVAAMKPLRPLTEPEPGTIAASLSAPPVLAAAAAEEKPAPKARIPSVVMHPARLARKELSMIRQRATTRSR